VTGGVLHFGAEFLDVSVHILWGTHGGGEGRGVYTVLVGRPEGKKPLVRSRRRWEDNIKMD
jgi:hypothetical protein